MQDLYFVLVPLYAVLTLLDLVALKLALADNAHTAKLTRLQSKKHNNIAPPIQSSPLRHTIRHFLTHFTLIEIFAVRRAKYKLIFLLSVSLISIAAFAIPSPFAFLFVGTVTYFTYFGVALVLSSGEAQKEQQKEGKVLRQKYLMVICSLMTIVINLMLIGLTYKNYKNSKLSTYANSTAFNLLLDNFVARPIISVLFAIPMSRLDAVSSFINNIEKQILLVDNHETNQLQNRQEKMFSPSKIAKRIPINIEMSGDFIQHQSLVNRDENIAKSLQIMKLMKTGRYQNNESFQPGKSYDQQSLNSLFNTSKKQDSSACKDNPLDEKIEEYDLKLTSKNKSNANDNLVMIHPSLQEQDNNEEQLHTEEIGQKINTLQSNEEDNPSNFALKLISNDGVQIPLKFSFNEPSDPSGPSSKNQPLRIYINGQQKQMEVDYQQVDVESQRYRRRNSINNQQYSNRNYGGALEIKQNNHVIDEIQELDMNSPERRNRIYGKQQEDSIKLQAVIKKKKKKMSHDERNRVIKFTTGEPYLQYLPNMLSKESKTKKSMALVKRDMLDSHAVSNVSKRPAIKKRYNQNNQNIIPQFHVQDL